MKSLAGYRQVRNTPSCSAPPGLTKGGAGLQVSLNGLPGDPVAERPLGSLDHNPSIYPTGQVLKVKVQEMMFPALSRIFCKHNFDIRPAGLSATKKPGHEKGLTYFFGKDLARQQNWSLNKKKQTKQKNPTWFWLKCCRPSFLSTLCHCITLKREILPSAIQRTKALICKPQNTSQLNPV